LHNELFIAISLKNEVVVITNVKIINNDDKYSCEIGDSHLILYITNVIDLHYNDLVPEYVYATRSYPPSVVEINIVDLHNPYVFKVYRISGTDKQYIGLPLVAINVNFVIHSIYDANKL
jgi:hypothetical protein